MKTRHRMLFGLLTLALVLGSCGSPPPETPAPTTEAEDDFIPVISATGKVVPEHWASLSLATPGVIESIEVVEGDVVGEGKVLLRLGGREQLEAALASARLEELLARQALEDVYLQEDVARALAQQALANARDELRKADYDWTVQQEGNRASGDTIKRARANVVIAEDRVKKAKSAYDRTPGDWKEDAGKAQALAAYLGAKGALDAARRAYNWYTGHPTEIQQGMLDADVAVARALLGEAEQVWGDVLDGPDPDLLALAQMRLESARAGVEAAQAALRDSELRAPFAGTIGSVRIRRSEWVSPGIPLVDIANMDGLQVETTDLSEIDAARVAIGSPATITFDALPDVEVTGRVVRIAPKASEGSGVNYTAWIVLDEIPEGLMWGMTAFVDIEAVP